MEESPFFFPPTKKATAEGCFLGFRKIPSLKQTSATLSTSKMGETKGSDDSCVPFGILFTLFSGANLLLVLGEWEVYLPEG